VHRSPLVAQAIHHLLCGEPDIGCSGWATTATAALERLDGSSRTWVIDQALPQSGAMVLSDALESRDQPRRMVLLADLEGDDELDSILPMMRRGVTGVVSIDAGTDCFVHAVRAVVAGEMWLPRRLGDRLLQSLQLTRTAEDQVIRCLLRLTEREREVLVLLCAGHGRTDIAADLHISAHTARTHVQRIIEKFNVHSQGEVVALGVRHRLPQRFALA